LELQLLAFNCYACHERDGRGGVARYRRDHFETVAKIDLGDEGRLPPPLTGVGHKLQPAWLKNVLLGKADVRPHMQIRMPAFHSDLATKLPQLFREVDQDGRENFMLTDKAESAEVGRQLMDVGCVQCHAFGGNSLPGVIGVDLRNVSSRLQPNWFQEFLTNPSALKARTRMPSFFPDGKSQRPDLLEGDINRQIATMWAYLNAKENVELPDKIKEARARNYELRPTDKPIVLRTFMKDVGTHAIAVGFPQQIHYAFDAEKVRLAIGWRGKFLDAQGTWFVRFAPPAEPLGEAVFQFADLVPIAKLTEANEAWPSRADDYRFDGYRLDSLGVPTILYRFRNIEVEDRLAPIDAETLGRTVKLRRDSAGAERLFFLAAADKKLTRISDQVYANHAGLRTMLVDRTGKLRTSRLLPGGERDEWLVPIEFEKAFELELHYQW
jgi:mono/diheme cytochrome c family protein